MRKKLLLFGIALLIFTSPAGAQKESPIKLGLKFAPNVSFLNPSTKDYSSAGAKLGGVVGLVTDFYFAEHYAFSTGLNFSFLGGKISYPDSAEYNKSKIYGTTKDNLSFVYIEIPIMIKMCTKKFGNFDFFGQVGFGTGFRIAATAKTEFTGSNWYEYEDKRDNVDGTTTIRESVLIGIGADYFFDQSTRLFFGLGYSNSLNNILKGENVVLKENQKAYLNYVELNLGIMF